MRWLSCFFGLHAPDTANPIKAGDIIIGYQQRCLYCDKVVTRYTVTADGIIRRKI